MNLSQSDAKNTFKGKYQEFLADKNIVKRFEAEAVLSRLFPKVLQPALNLKAWFHPDIILTKQPGSKSTN
ncbi:MAG: hypothetical protein DI538_25985 [Azospira oryzae]|jgi:hypothetical protein|nr:MAG: hypothetical protein DI538_25985 [Azospira oryzae]